MVMREKKKKKIVERKKVQAAQKKGIKPITPVQTPKQAAETARQRADREARGQIAAGPGQEFVPPRAPLTAEVQRVGTREEVIALEDRPGKEPTEIKDKPKKWLQWREDSPMNQPVTIAQVVEATALGLGIAAGGVGLASLGVAGVAAAGGLAGQAGVTGARVTAKGVVLKSAAGLLTKETITRTATKAGGRVAVNTVTSKLTSSWLTKLAVGAGISMFATSILKDIIGTYPFAGFLKEENIQQLDLGTKQALDAAQWQGADPNDAKELIELRKQVLEPDMWGSIIGAVPYKNTIDNLKEFYKGATAKIKVDEKRLARLSEETGTKEFPGELVEE